MSAHLEFYEDEDAEYRWRLKARNGRTIADSGEGYTREADAVKAAMRAKEAFIEAVYEFVHGDEDEATMLDG